MTSKPKPAAEPPLPDELWALEKVMAFLNVSRAQVFKLIKHGGLPHIKLSGGALRFDPRDLADWLEKRKAG